MYIVHGTYFYFYFYLTKLAYMYIYLLDMCPPYPVLHAYIYRKPAPKAI